MVLGFMFDDCQILWKKQRAHIHRNHIKEKKIILFYFNHDKAHCESTLMRV